MPAPSSTPTEPAVAADGVAKRFRGGVQALDGVSFAVPPGTVVALAGPNGSGKSTLLSLVAGILAVDAGSLRVLGMDPRRGGGRLRSMVGYAGQHAALDPEMTGTETLRLFHALHRLPDGDRDARLARIRADEGLGAFCDRQVSTWSGGQRQRLHLALAAMHSPRLLLLDEPTAGLDPDARRALWRRLSDARAAGTTVLVATHDLADAAAHADRVLLFRAGRVVADAAPAHLVAAHARARATLRLASPPNDVDAITAALAALPDAPRVEVDGATVTLARARHPDGRDPALDVLEARGLAWTAYERHAPDLADAYVRLTGSRWDDRNSDDAGGVEGGGRRGTGRGAGRGKGRRG